MAHVSLLNLQGNHIGDPGVLALAPLLRNLPRLEALYIDFNGITEDGALPRLGHLSLGANLLGDDGMRALAAAIAGGGLARLELLHLGNNDIGDAGAKALAAACVSADTLPRLEELFLDDNEIGDAGMRALAAAIAGGGWQG